ncbi:MAG: isoprenyl transferase [Candidatus Omnitrophota bacterium]
MIPKSKTLPKHIAIIMDGNRRWAEQKKLSKIRGHRAGLDALEEVIKACAKSGIETLTLYAFSTENWRRSKIEVDTLLSLFEESMKSNFEKLCANNIRINVIGRIEAFPSSIANELAKYMEKSSKNTGMTVTFALNYGARQEIVDAVKSVFEKVKEKDLDVSSLDEKGFREFLYTGDLCDPDMIIRTGGEMRLSNFLLWQAAYSEIYVTDTLWPDFNEKELEKALDEYAKRSRRFGK